MKLQMEVHTAHTDIQKVILLLITMVDFGLFIVHQDGLMHLQQVTFILKMKKIMVKVSCAWILVNCLVFVILCLFNDFFKALPYFNDIGAQFLLNKPYVYSSNMNSYQQSKLPNLVSVLNKDFYTSVCFYYLLRCKLFIEFWHYQSPQAASINIESSQRVQLRTFAKNAAWNHSLYEDLAEPGINSGMLVETWQNGSGGVSLNCQWFIYLFLDWH